MHGLQSRMDRARSDAGITLAELLIYSFLAIIVLTLVGQFLINSLRVDAQVRDGAAAASNAQVAAASIGQGIRNASAVDLIEPEPGLLVLRTRSIGGGEESAWFCQAWAIQDGNLRWTISPDAIPVSAEAIASWTLIVDSVQPATAKPFFVVNPADRAVDFAFTIANGDGAPILIDTTAVSRQPIPATGRVSLPCFGS